MNLPDRWANEPTAEVDHALWQEYLRAKSAREGWAKIEAKCLEAIKASMGDAYAITYEGAKVATNRPQANYAVARLCADYPDLTQHYMRVETKSVLNVDLFTRAHPEIAEKYRVRSFREITE